MSVVLVVADQLVRANDLVQRGVRIGSRLGAHGVSCVYMTPPKSCALPGGVSLGNPELGLPSIPCWISTDETTSTADSIDAFLRDSRIEALISGLECRTGTVNRFDSVLLSRVFGTAELLVISPELSDADSAIGLRGLLKLTNRSIVVSNSQPWKRIVVAAADSYEETELQSWSDAWGRRFGLDVTTTYWLPKVRHEWQWPRSRLCPRLARCINFPMELKSTDLVLLSRSRGGGIRRQMRRAAAWESLVAQQHVSLGIAPLFYTNSMAGLFRDSALHELDSAIAS